MFEDKTYENILNDMLSRVPSDVDKREGSIIYDAIAPAAFELAQMYFNLNNYIDLFFADTAVGEFLDRKAADNGLARKQATKAIRQIETTGPIDAGTRWGLNDTTYIITEQISENIYKAECEQPGTIGNLYSGALENINNVSGVTAVLADILTPGADTKTDDNLRERLREDKINPAQNGNNAQYKKWAIEYPDIGTAKVFPLWNGGNTVKIAITNGLYQPAEQSLVEKFQDYIDPGSEGKGNGVAPLGAKVTVTGGIPKSINVAANVILSEGYIEPTGAAEAISGYLASIVYEKNSVSYMRIGGALLDCQSISDISGLTVNSKTIDVDLGDEEIPVLGNLNLAVVSE